MSDNDNYDGDTGTKPRPSTEPETVSSHAGPADTTADTESLHKVARDFLQDEKVKEAPVERKIEYLRQKGLAEDDISRLLEEEGAVADANPKSQDSPEDPQSQSSADSVQPQTADYASSFPTKDTPPVVTYPEFLTKPIRPPPLVSGTAILNTLYAFAGLSTLLYGTSQYVVSPMVDSLTESRHAFHDAAAQKLETIVHRLESCVSEIPPTAGSLKPEQYKDAAVTDGDETAESSDAEDPTETFHRDIGVQTSLPPTPDPSNKASQQSGDTQSSSAEEAASTRQASKLFSLTATLRALSTDYISQSEDLADVKTVMNTFMDDLSNLTYPGPLQSSDFVGGLSMYGSSNKNEPEDELKKARDNIRRVKGVMLSTRNFPGSVR